MIKRFVKLTFRPELVSDFLALFEETKDRIRHLPGCLHLELLWETDQENVFFTCSFWENEAALDAYRHSELFKDTWARTRALFLEKAEAWTMEVVSEAKD